MKILSKQRTSNFPMKTFLINLSLVVKLVCVCAGTAIADLIVVDGSLGGNSQQLVGPNYQIDASLGQTRGNNLFHSFSAFNLNSNESANFSGPSNISNIFGRVTGSNFSSIDGTLSSDISGANLWLINPNGIVFGSNARIDVSGSFHATTADYIQFDNDERFYSAQDATDSILSVANPSAFGFTREQPVGIVAEGSVFEMQAGQTFSLVSGPITLTDVTLRASAGRINLATVGSPGTVTINPSPTSTESGLSLSEGTQRESINLVNSIIDLSGGEGGKLFIIGGEIFANSDSLIQNNIDLAGTDARIEIDADELIVDGAQISMRNDSTGEGGKIQIIANNISIQNNNANEDDDSSQISSDATNDGQGADIRITAVNRLEILGGQIESKASGNGESGSIYLQGGDIVLDNGNLLNLASGNGGSGQINISGKSLQLSNQSTVISKTSNGDSQGLDIIISDELSANGGVSITTESSGTGKGGDIIAEAGTISLADNSEVKTTASGTGDAGNISLCANQGFNINSVLISSDATSSAGGNIDLASDNSMNLTNSNVLASGQSGGNVAIRSCSDNKRLAGKAGDNSGTLNYIVQNDTRIQALSQTDGNVTIDAERIFQSLKSSTSATGELLVNANNAISKPPEQEEPQARVLTIPVIFSLPRFVNTPCANKLLKNSSSFVAKASAPLTRTPADWYPSSTSAEIPLKNEHANLATPFDIASLENLSMECYL